MIPQSKPKRMSPPEQNLKLVKVRAGFYRVGAYCIHKGHRWCVYLRERHVPDTRFRTLQEASWWAQNHQPERS